MLGDTDPDWRNWTSITASTLIPASHVLIATALFCQEPLSDRIAVLYDTFAPDIDALIGHVLHVLTMVSEADNAISITASISSGVDLTAKSDTGRPRCADRDAFLAWASTDLALGRFLHRHTAHVDVRVGRVQARLALMDALDRYDRAASRMDQTMPGSAARYLLGQLAGDGGLAASEAHLLDEIMDERDRMDRLTFESMAQALILFGIVSKGTRQPLPYSQAETLIRLQMRFDPTRHRVRAELESLGYAATDDDHPQMRPSSTAWTLTRPRWMQSKRPGAQFDLALYLEFEVSFLGPDTRSIEHGSYRDSMPIKAGSCRRSRLAT